MVDDRFVMCPSHWQMVPRPLQLAVWRASKVGGEGHRAAMQAAVKSVAKTEGKPYQKEG